MSCVAEGERSVNKLITHYSEWLHLKKAVAWILRLKGILLQLSKKRREVSTAVNRSLADNDNKMILQRMQIHKITLGSKPHTVEELMNAETEIVRFSQVHTFQQEIVALKKGHNIKRSSRLHKLDPILLDGILKVGGRLQHSVMTEEAKHPAILANDCHVATLILRHIHKEVGHYGRNYILAKLREHYWITGANSAARKVISTCVIYRKVKA